MTNDDEDIARLRVPPHSVEAEQAVLAALLQDGQAWDRVGDLLADGDFYRQEHRLIFGAIASLVNAGKPADVVTVFERLGAKADDCGGLSGINALAQSVASAGNIRRYAEIVRERAILRKLIAASDEIATAAFNPQGRSVADQLGQAEARVLAVGQVGAASSSYRRMPELTRAMLDRVSDLYEKGGSDLVGVATGFEKIDAATAGLQAGDLIVLAARPSMGKALSVDSHLLTPTGWLRMGDVKVGDSIVGGDGRAYPVLGVFPQGRLPLFRVTFDDGGEVLCCDDHLWLTSARADRKAGRKQGRVRKLSEIRATLRAGGREQRLSHQIPWVQPPDLAPYWSNPARPLDPYLLGLWLGDGSMSGAQVRFHNSEPDLVARFRRALQPSECLRGAGGEWRVARKTRNNERAPMSLSLERIGLAGAHADTKFVPEPYLWASAEERLALLRGLLDTDGYCYGAGVEYTTASPDLAEAVRFLVRSLGGRVTTVVRSPTFKYLGEQRTGLPSHRMVISFDSDLVPVSSEKHLAAFRGVRRRTGRYIAAVEPAGRHEAQCITVGSPDGLFVTNDFVVTHNTALAMNIAEHVALALALPVAVFSMEMSASQLTLRMAGSVGKISGTALRTGRLQDPQWGRLAEAVDKLGKADIMIDESPGLRGHDIRSRARRMARDAGRKLGLIVIDYLQLMASGGDENRATELGDITRELKGMAKELDCPVILLSQLNRSVESRNDKRPMMSDLRDSGAIEQDADVIAFIYRDDYYTKGACKEPGVAEIILAKQRSGPVCTVRLGWAGDLTRFYSLAPDYEPGREPPAAESGFD